MKTVVTHNGKFHADDVFAVAVLELYAGNELSVIRTRDPEKIRDADFVVDVGTVYDPKAGRFDHHQEGGAGKRSNGIPYASFGLVWKAYGKSIAGGAEIAERVDSRLVVAIDADDNGISLYDPKFAGVKPFEIDEVISLFVPTWKEEGLYDQQFPKAVSYAKQIISRLIQKESDRLEARREVEKAYQEAKDKRLIVLERYLPWNEWLVEHPEPLYVVCPSEGTWRVMAVRSEKIGFEMRKPLPEAWAGKRDGELVTLTGVEDSVFCHNARFLAVSRSKEGALKLAQIALNA